MNAVEARSLMKSGIEEKRIDVIGNLNIFIEKAAKRHQTSGTVTLTSKAHHFSDVVKADHLYGVPVDKGSVESYLDHLRMAGFVVDELFCSYNEARLHISWEEE